MTLTAPVTPENRRRIESLLRETSARGGLAPVDLERFWSDNEAARKNPFGLSIPQIPFGAVLTGECVYDELGIPEDYWRYNHDEEWRIGLNREYNDKAERIVGRRILSESRADPSLLYPPRGGLHDVFESRNVWHGHSWWLQQAARTPDELRALLDRVNGRDIRSAILPPGWDEAKARLLPLGIKPPLYRGQRGPVTFATSVYGAENLLFLIADEPDLAARFRDAILRAMLEIGRILDEEAGYTPLTAPHGFWFADDNCMLLNPEMYEFFGYPVLKGIFDRYSPDPCDQRYQHSDSEMGHLLPILAKLAMTGVNFGPRLTVTQIREHLPKAVIDGQLAPFTYSRNEEENMMAEFLRDRDMAKAGRGLVFTTAGSINNGTRLTSMRLLMAAIQRTGPYDG